MIENKLDPTILSESAQKLQDFLSRRVLGQPRAIQNFIKSYQAHLAGMSRPEKPTGAYLFLGPSGVGKTELVKSVALSLFGRAEAFLRIDCAEFQHSHEVAKLLGSPPGYVGFREGARLAQQHVDRWRKDANKNKPSIILFDEIEKAHDSLFDALLGILDSGTVTLGDGTTTDFKKSIIFCTSNLGAQETRKLLTESHLGFSGSHVEDNSLDEKIYRVCKQAVEKRFRPEFINRFDRSIVFHSLTREILRDILKNEIHYLEKRVSQSVFKDWEPGSPIPNARVIRLEVTPEAREFILDEGTSDVYGARELNRAIERYLGHSIACFLARNELQHNDKLLINYENKEVTFQRQRQPGPTTPAPKADLPTNPDGDRILLPEQTGKRLRE